MLLKVCLLLFIQSTTNYIVVDISEQILLVYNSENFILKSYPISTSKYGIGNKANSNKTPIGKHIIANKIGYNAPIGTIFKARINTGKIATIYTDNTDKKEDLITSRILWLRGLENGTNSGKDIDSYNRFIYIHGTNEEGLIGNPASHGCVRMNNKDVIELFELIEEKTVVYIQE